MAFETAVIGGMIGVMFLWAYIAFNIGRDLNQDDSSKFEPFRVLLILMVFLGIEITLFAMKLIAEDNLSSLGRVIESAFNVYSVVFAFVVFYFMAMLAVFIIKKMMEKKPNAN